MSVSLPARLDVADARARALASPDAYAVIDTRHGVELGFYAPPDEDRQQPHRRDELYLIAIGSGVFRRGDETIAFGPGDLLFVAAGTPHRFEGFTPGFGTWVLFFGAEG